MEPLTFRNGISIAVLILYIPILFVGAFLSKRHGFGRSSGWIFLVIFSTLRLVSAAINLALINSPKSTGLYTAYAITTSVGLSPLLLTALGLLNRAIESIERRGSSVTVSPRHLRMIQILVMIGLILSINGGVNASDAKTEKELNEAHPLTEAGAGLFIAGFVILTLATVRVLFSISSAEPGERRLIPALAAVLPFMLVRVIYSSIGAFAHNVKFNAAMGNDVIFLVMVILMELAVVLIFEGVGLTLRAIPKEERGKAGDYVDMPVRRGLVGRLAARRYEPERRAPVGQESYEPERVAPVGQRRYGA